MTIHIARFVAASDLFGGSPLAREALEDAGHFSWGDCTRSLVSLDALRAALDQDGRRDPDVNREIAAVHARLHTLPPDVTVDLET